MQPGRHPIWNVIATLEPSAWFEAARLAPDERLALPMALRKRVSWCATQTSVPLLAVIGAEAEVTIAPIEERRGELAALSKLLEATAPDERAPLTFAAMSSYSQVSLQPDGRIRLSPMVADHLRGTSGDKVWVGAYGDVVTVWSDRAWYASMEGRASALRKAVAGLMGAAPTVRPKAG